MARTNQTPSTQTANDHWRMQLNNFLQVNGGTRRLQYVDVASGPAHRPTWHSTVYIDDVPYAQGYAGDKGEARENAARNCYMILRPQ